MTSKNRQCQKKRRPTEERGEPATLRKKKEASYKAGEQEKIIVRKKREDLKERERERSHPPSQGIKVEKGGWRIWNLREQRGDHN